MIHRLRPYLTFSLSCLSLALLGYWLIHERMPVIMAGIWLTGLLVRPFREAFSNGFQRIMKALGNLQVAIIMAVVYVLVLWPMAMVYQRKHRKTTPVSSTLVFRNHLLQPADLDKLW